MVFEGTFWLMLVVTAAAMPLLFAAAARESSAPAGRRALALKARINLPSSTSRKPSGRALL
jgi:hypothetical protein